MDNAIFERDQGSFFRKIESSTSHEGQIPEIEKFVEFWGGIWKKEERTPEMPWMEKVREDLTRKINRVDVFDITEKSLTAENNKKKNWTAPGIDRIQNTGGRNSNQHRGHQRERSRKLETTTT